MTTRAQRLCMIYAEGLVLPRRRSSSARVTAGSATSACRLGGLESGVVVWLAHLVCNILRMDHMALSVEHEDRPLEQPPLLEENAIVASKPLAFVGGERLVSDPFIGPPARLRVGQIHADGVD